MLILTTIRKHKIANKEKSGAYGAALFFCESTSRFNLLVEGNRGFWYSGFVAIQPLVLCPNVKGGGTTWESTEKTSWYVADARAPRLPGT